MTKGRMFELTVGADPEFFFSEEAGKPPIMACGRFGGTKGSPVLMEGGIGGYLEDGTAVEFNVVPSESLAEARKKIVKLITAFEADKKTKVHVSSTATFTHDSLKAHPQAMTIGCSADLYAYGLRNLPQIGQFKNNRFAGGHIHVGINPWPEGLQKASIVRLLDWGAYIPYAATLSDSYRYKFYGYPGLYRETGYGVEYRSPDNWWCNPAYYESSSRDKRTWINGFVSTVDKLLYRLVEALCADGHGHRFEDEFNEWLARAGCFAQMGPLAVRRDLNSLSRMYQGTGGLLTLLSHLLVKGKTKKKGDNALDPDFFEEVAEDPE